MCVHNLSIGINLGHVYFNLLMVQVLVTPTFFHLVVRFHYRYWYSTNSLWTSTNSLWNTLTNSIIYIVHDLLQFSAQGSVNEETKELLGRVAELQKEKWALEERVSGQ